jgi:hypothetical protein
MTSYDFDERLSDLERGHNALQIGFDTGEQRGTARIAQPKPHHCGPTVQQQVDGEVFVLRDDCCANFIGVGANGRIRTPQEPAIRNVLAEVTGRRDAASESGRELRVDEEAH